MKKLLASIAALGLLASTGAATASTTNTKTIVTKSGNAKATTTVSTKVTPIATKGQRHARVTTHSRHSGKRMASAKMPTKAAKPAASTKTSG